ncbi:hypothetical protein J8273_8278 [Carpediemonas membranifera]|uniref:Uncharacterized protein n=1 Tax=Carpediemonas membranifera TaxID=201153 RepID=A0A8J6APY4_9EUKA|nr:hypothetical protein J8273_8278 [Carpediemonas membranifera]|eukprot:KAG9390238.1 hypothetical protein J8273_8278 [Carpediemonas membranifera]
MVIPYRRISGLGSSQPITTTTPLDNTIHGRSIINNHVSTRVADHPASAITSRSPMPAVHIPDVSQEPALPAELSEIDIHGASTVYVMSPSGTLVPIETGTFIHYHNARARHVRGPQRSVGEVPTPNALSSVTSRQRAHSLASTPKKPFEQLRRRMDALRHDDPGGLEKMLSSEKEFLAVARSYTDSEELCQMIGATSIHNSPAEMRPETLCPTPKTMLRAGAGVQMAYALDSRDDSPGRVPRGFVSIPPGQPEDTETPIAAPARDVPFDLRRPEIHTSATLNCSACGAFSPTSSEVSHSAASVTGAYRPRHLQTDLDVVHASHG